MKVRLLFGSAGLAIVSGLFGLIDQISAAQEKRFSGLQAGVSFLLLVFAANALRHRLDRRPFLLLATELAQVGILVRWTIAEWGTLHGGELMLLAWGFAMAAAALALLPALRA